MKTTQDHTYRLTGQLTPMGCCVRSKPFRKRCAGYIGRVSRFFAGVILEIRPLTRTMGLAWMAIAQRQHRRRAYVWSTPALGRVSEPCEVGGCALPPRTSVRAKATTEGVAQRDACARGTRGQSTCEDVGRPRNP